MRILVVCGAGASSTFVAHRVNRAARAAGLSWSAFAGTQVSLPVDLDSADIVLVGPHLTTSLDAIREAASPRGVAVVPLPDDVFTDTDGTRVLALVRAVAAPDAPASE